MRYAELLRQAVLAEIRDGRIGEPVFVRLTLSISADHGHLFGAAVLGTALCEELLNCPTEVLQASGSVAAGHLSVQLHLARGKTALIVVAALHDASPRLDVLLLGNHGSVAHAPHAAALADFLRDETSPPSVSSPRGAVLESALRASIERREMRRLAEETK